MNDTKENTLLGLGYSLRITTIDPESGAQSTAVAPVGDEKRLLGIVRDSSVNNHIAIAGDGGEDANEPPTRVMVVAFNGVVVWAHFTDAPLNCPDVGEAIAALKANIVGFINEQ